jgi:hypothetical protein
MKGKSRRGRVNELTWREIKRKEWGAEDRRDAIMAEQSTTVREMDAGAYSPKDFFRFH